VFPDPTEPRTSGRDKRCPQLMRARWRFPLRFLSALAERSFLRRLFRHVPALDRFRITLRAMQDGRRVIGRLANREAVWSSLGDDHLLAHPEVKPYLDEVLRTIVLDPTPRITKPFFHDFRKTIGHSALVPTTDADDVVYIRRAGRSAGCSRGVRNREPVPCSSLVVILHRNAYGVVALMTSYIGTLTPPEPCSKSGRTSMAMWEECVRFWKNHALVFTGEHDPAFGVRQEEPDYWIPPVFETAEATPAQGGAGGQPGAS